MSGSPSEHAGAVGHHFAAFDRRDWHRPVDRGPLRFAVVGVGTFAKNRALPAISTVEQTETTVFVSNTVSESDPVAREYDIEAVVGYDEFHAGAATDDYDAVYVAAPNAFHREYAESAAKHGKHVLCEKPLATSVADARSMVDACEDAGVTLMTAYRLHVEPATRRTRELVQEGYIGRPVQVHSTFATKLLDGHDDDHWRLDPSIAGGGATIDLGVYPINAIRFLLDEDPVTVQGVTNAWGSAFDRVEEHAAFQLTFPSGVVASCSTTFDGQPDSHLQLVGTDGSISIDSPYGGDVPQEVTVECGDMRMEYTGAPVDDVCEEVAYFANHVLTGRRPGPDGRDGLTDLRVVEAVYDSAENGRRVELDADD
ncbi:xylose dehydrogenase (NAD/NADP) [Natronoarchaeum philippinense]|uniref:Xylose dehydrogenase (NAD/NADP) n=1 Tax=Natronoarchaeum philippinense TaxID=558529 RepID=A0A285P6Q4_NATPI|nr:D-xylose 1-dehydrogenase Gfo6 [Natronoarchaeum philippinense]SNZ17414.1 xylose dehydrogenase (NAD/NADP) [Natronoarchaeum philippinense]